MLNVNLSEQDDAAKIEQKIAVLQHDLPVLFQQDISYDIYSRDIFFQDPVNTFKGKLNYRIIFWTLRFHGRLFFTELYFDLHDVHQASATTIRADWTVRGTLRLPWKPKLLFNGYSIYTLNSTMLICRHIDTWDRSPRDILKQFWSKGWVFQRAIKLPACIPTINAAWFLHMTTDFLPQRVAGAW